ncbi:hypothetical protein [Paenirhodobacter populi]|uniref:hypothetical protein n=1 Tax=Paenirhodobacter populi TaxID=2306993 RepID=UPI0013E28E37|nr:hypothetical protein [Sinirhodobacter populi]
MVIEEIYKLESGLASMGLQAAALTKARDMLARLSRQVHELHYAQSPKADKGE